MTALRNRIANWLLSLAAWVRPARPVEPDGGGPGVPDK